jgi:indolepyruvate ferredoxin oxidoreductase beta subunit
MEGFNVFLIGVGGQGIGLLSEVILRAADHANLRVKAVDTHGLAQRGGIVISQIRIGEKVFSPLIASGQADLVLALERHEALRGTLTAIKHQGTLVYYDTVLQPLFVRLNRAEETRNEEIARVCDAKKIRLFRVYRKGLPDVRMQNMIVLARVASRRLIPKIEVDHYLQAMDDLMAGEMLKANLAVFEAEQTATQVSGQNSEF